MMVTRNAETNQGDSGVSYAPPPPAPADQLRSRAGNTVFKSGPLFISSKGIGWTSWKKRWFILTRTSLVFFRSDPSILPQKGSEVNLTLGGIDLNNSGSVVVREDKKLLTVLFPDGRDGRAFTLKAETSEDLYDWKAALENALQQAPSAALVMGQNGIFRNDPSETADGATEQWKDRRPVKSLVVGRPILLALEDIDGAPSFLEKALTFIETHGVKVEGVLRQAADVDDVNRRVREYEEGKNEFTSEEDAHIIADCVKHVLRGLPSSPVPASCCNALLEACRADRGVRVNAMRAAISETFPEPNRRLLQRILKMMQIVASHKSENRMSSSAVAACMAPLLLRPLLAGDCELENDFTMGGDGSVQLLQAAAAANHAQAIVITLMEDYQKIFGDGSLQGSISPEIYSDSEESGSEDDELTDDDEHVEDDGDFDSQNDSDGETGDDHDDAFSVSASECTVNGDEQYDNKASEGSDSDLGSVDLQVEQKSSNETQNFIPQHENEHCNGSSKSLRDTSSVEHASESHESSVDDVPVTASPAAPVETDHSLSAPTEADHTFSSLSRKLTTKSSSKPLSGPKRHTIWGRTSAKKNLSMESIDFHNEEEAEIQKLESAKSDLQTKIVKEAKENAALHTSLEKRKKALHDRRLALEQDVAGLQEQLQKERDLRAAMEARLNIPQGPITMSPSIDNKTKAELEDISRTEEDVINLKNKVADLHLQLNQQRKNNSGLGSCSQPGESLNLHGKQGDEREDSETTSVAPLHERPTKTEEVLSRADSKHVKTQETPSLQRKLTEEPQLDLPVHEGNKSFGSPGTPSPVGLGTVAPSVSSNSKKSGSKVEGNATTSSALSKLTTRLNFLKERRTQIVNELQNIESSRGSETQLLAAAPRTNSR